MRTMKALSGSYVLCLQAFPALGHLVGHLVAFLEGLEPVPGYARVVHEDVLAPIIRAYKAVALLVAEPLDRSFWGHAFAPAFPVPGLHQTKVPPYSTGWRSICCNPPYVATSVYQKLHGVLGPVMCRA